MSFHKHGTRIGRTVTYFVVFVGVVPIVLLLNAADLLVREHAPATLQRKTAGKAKKQAPTFRLKELIVQ